jgi:hypothetical protein
MPSHTAPERCETLRPEVAAGACSSPVVRSSRRQWAAGVRIMCHRGHGLAVRVRRNVISTERKDHIATVITDSGQRVTVLGTEGGFPESFRSTDRRYALGGLYEFHPLNGESPYRDNICTATQQLAGPRLRPLPPPNDFLPDWLPIDEQAGFVGYLLFFGPVAAGVVLLILAGRKVFQRFTARAG